MCAHIDLLPTLADLCAVTIPDAVSVSLDGVSVAGLLTGTTDSCPERPLFFRSGRAAKAKFPGAVRTPKWRAARLRGDWELYDMQADPSQKNDVAPDHPDVLKELAGQYTRWHAEVTRDLVERTPVPVGHPDAVVTGLYTPESFQEGGLEWPNGPGWTTEWLRNWRSTGDRIWWDLDVLHGGEYEVSISYGCPPDQAGSVLRIECGKESLETTISHPFDPAVRRRPDRQSDVNWMQCDFTTRPAGKLSIPAGNQRLTIRALKIPADEVAEFQGLLLKRLD